MGSNPTADIGTHTFFLTYKVEENNFRPELRHVESEKVKNCMCKKCEFDGNTNSSVVFAPPTCPEGRGEERSDVYTVLSFL